jgi:hypothetical protein
MRMAKRLRRTRPASLLAPGTLLRGFPDTDRELDDEGVHQLRRASKNARAILRLAEDAGRPGARELRCALTRAVRPLAPLRDAKVVARFASKLESKLKSDARAAAHALATTRPPAKGKPWWTSQARQLAKVRADVQSFDHAALEPAEIAAALRRSADRVCKRVRRVKGKHRLTLAHDWRKSIQILHDQLIAAPPAGVEVENVVSGLKAIAHELGTSADCTAVIQAVKKRHWADATGNGPKKLIAAVRKKQKKAIRSAFKGWRKVRPVIRKLQKAGPGSK